MPLNPDPPPAVAYDLAGPRASSARPRECTPKSHSVFANACAGTAENTPVHGAGLSGVSRFLANIPPLQRLLYLLVTVALMTTHAAPGSWNAASRIATVQSLVEFHTFIIDKTVFIGTGDKVFVDGHFYSDKPPIPSVLGAAVYWPLYHAGLRLHLGSSIPYYLVTLLTVRLFWVLGTVAFFFALAYTGLDEEKRFLASVALSLGSLYFSWSSTYNSHALAASFLSIGFYFLIRARFAAVTNFNLGAAGFFLSLASSADVPTGIFYALFLAYILRDPRLRRGAIFFVLPLLVTLVPALVITYSIHHSIVPVQIVASYFQYPGSPWVGSDQLSGMHANPVQFALTYALSSLVGPKGFLLYDPIMAIALWGLVRTIRSKGPFFYEGLVVAVGSAVLVLYYLLATNNYGGWSYSIRWFVPLLPLLFFFVYPWFESYGPARARQFRVLLYVAIVIAFVGAIDPWSHRDLSEVPFIANLKEIPIGLRALRSYAAPAAPATCNTCMPSPPN
jgi:hypothetical protein